MLDLANTWGEDPIRSSTEVLLCQIAAYALFIVAFLYFCLIVVLRTRIKLAIAVVKEAGHAITDMPMILTLPILQALGLVVFLAPWVVYMMYLASSGDMYSESQKFDIGGSNTVDVQVRYFEYNDETNYALAYQVFAFFWTSQFIIAMGQLIVAMSVACWYFTKDGKRGGNGTFLWALKTSWVHAGTAAFGSLVVAIIKYTRMVLAYVQKKLAKSQNQV